jgi:TQXA domain-containing protein
MKIKSIFIILLLILLLSNFNYNCWALQLGDETQITTEQDYVGEVQYEDFIIKAKIIREVKTNAIGYCLEINKDYPSGETFKSVGYATEELAGILSAGYPSKTYSELNLNSEEEAYFATQVAIWSLIEGYDVDAFRGERRVVEAIKKIYNEGTTKQDELYFGKFVIYDYNETEQSVVFAKNEQNEKDSSIEDSGIIEGNFIYGK